MSSIVEIIDGDEGWTDVILPDGALKTDKLQGLVGFQEQYETLCKPYEKEFIDIIKLYTISVKGIYTSDYDSREKIETKEESG